MSGNYRKKIVPQVRTCDISNDECHATVIWETYINIWKDTFEYSNKPREWQTEKTAHKGK